MHDIPRLPSIHPSIRLDDSWFMGSVAMIANHPEGLIENVFGSTPDGFKKYGVFTARWVGTSDEYVITCSSDIYPRDAGSIRMENGRRSSLTPACLVLLPRRM